MLPVEHLDKQGGILDNAAHSHKYPRTEDGFLIVGNFSHVSGAAENSVDESIGMVDTLRLRVLTNSESWVILNEVSLFK